MTGGAEAQRRRSGGAAGVQRFVVEIVMELGAPRSHRSVERAGRMREGWAHDDDSKGGIRLGSTLVPSFFRFVVQGKALDKSAKKATSRAQFSFAEIQDSRISF